MTSILLVHLLWMCSALAQTQDGWLRRNWHNMNARFNGLYHGNELLDQSIKSLAKKNIDDYNYVISVFPYGTPEQAQGEKANLEEVYKKASKVIRKHPKSRWVDDGWFLVGKSYFFQQDAYLAIETFQHVISQYPDDEKRFDAKLWIVKAYIQQEKYYDAEAIMALIVQSGTMPKRLNKEMAAVSAEIFINQKKYAQAIDQLKIALELAHQRDEKSRYHFILGQLYLLTNDEDNAKLQFAETIKLNPPYDMAFQSNLGLIKAISLSDDQSLKAPRKHLKKMLKDDKNIEYFDQIYYQLALLDIKDKNRESAISNYRLSAKYSLKNKDQKANSYLALATLFFEDKQYILSQKYFDSTAMFMTSKRDDYELIKAKQLVLTDLIENIVKIERLDSLLALSMLSKEDLEAKINAKIKAEMDLAAQAEKDKQNAADNGPIDPFNQPQKVDANASAGGQWYYYNPAAIGRGTSDFKRKWGDRPLTDNWRITSLASQRQNDPVNNTTDTTTNKPATDPTVYNPSNDKKTQDILKGIDENKRKYYVDIPLSDEAKAAANANILASMFNAGKIYEEDLKEFEKARSYFLELLRRYPSSSYEAETYFHLHKMATAEGNQAEQEKYANLLNTKYPKSPFNLVINNREVVENMNTDKEVSTLYEKAYNAYKNGNYQEALAIKDDVNKNFAGNSLQAKFDYLQALIIGQTKGEEAYIAALQVIMDNYPGTDIANTAAYTIEMLNNKRKAPPTAEELNTKFIFAPAQSHFYISVYEGGNAPKVQSAFSAYNAKLHGLENLKVTAYLLGDKNVVAVQTFNHKDAAEKYYVEFIKNDQFFKELGILSYDNFTISADNFRILLKDKNTDSYSVFFYNNYIQ